MLYCAYLVNDSARRSAADLAIGEAEAKQQPLDSLVDIDVVKDNDGALASKLQ